MDCTHSKQDLDEYYEYAKDAISSGIFSLFAHPDIWLGSYHKWDDAAIKLTDDLIKLCIQYDMPMGFNANGMHRERDGFNYPSELFWKRIVGTKAKVIIEADAHDLETLSEEWLALAQKEAVRIGLKSNLIDDIKLKYFKKK
jgi:histidinol phosphatase-like PHP family hydrolase